MSLEANAIDGSQRSFTEKISTAMVATRNSGTATMASVTTLSARSIRPPRFMADPMPMDRATGIATMAARAASSRLLGKRSSMTSPTGMFATID